MLRPPSPLRERAFIPMLQVKRRYSNVFILHQYRFNMNHIQERVSASEESMRLAAHGGEPCGSQRWRQGRIQASDVQATIRRPGRPRTRQENPPRVTVKYAWRLAPRPTFCHGGWPPRNHPNHRYATPFLPMHGLPPPRPPCMGRPNLPEGWALPRICGLWSPSLAIHASALLARSEAPAVAAIAHAEASAIVYLTYCEQPPAQGGAPHGLKGTALPCLLDKSAAVYRPR